MVFYWLILVISDMFQDQEEMALATKAEITQDLSSADSSPDNSPLSKKRRDKGDKMVSRLLLRIFRRLLFTNVVLAAR